MADDKKTVELKIPQTAHKVLSHMSASGCSLSEAARFMGVHQGTAHNVVKRAVRTFGAAVLIELYPGAENAIVAIIKKDKNATNITGLAIRPALSAEHPKDIDPANLHDAIQQKLMLAIGYLDRFNIAKAKVSELTSVIKTLFDAHQILQGKPTSITQTDNVRALKTLVPALVGELQRRGLMSLKGDVIEVVERQRKPFNAGKKVDLLTDEMTDGDFTHVEIDEATLKARGPEPKGRRVDGAKRKPGSGEHTSPRGRPPRAEGRGDYVRGPLKPRARSDFSKFLDDNFNDKDSQ